MKTAEELAQKRFARLVRLTSFYKRDLAMRLRESKRLLGGRVLAVDIHTHSKFSDGTGTLEENHACAVNAGLDFFFATDHASLRQKPGVKKWQNVSWGQEPGAGHHHIGLLRPSRLFRPRQDSIAADFERARGLAEFVWIPHPAGWYPQMWYPQERIDSLWTLGKDFAVEVMNGANKLVRAFDAFDAKAVEIWDKLLCEGRKVAALGGSDAHCPDEIGSVWTGIQGGACSARSIIKALNTGRCFASEAPLLAFSGDGKPMGSTLRKRRGASVKLHFRVADFGGLASIRIISNGAVIRKIRANGKRLVTGDLRVKVPSQRAYFRLETTASDDLRAFSSPIYIEPIP